jgi:hypothetical protein
MFPGMTVQPATGTDMAATSLVHSTQRPRAAVSPRSSAAAGAAILLFSLATVTHADPDLWGHLRFGLDILHTHALPSADPYSFTQDRPWVNHEWLSELQMGVAYTLGGVAGLSLLKSLLVSAALAVVWWGLAGVRPDVRIVVLGVVALGLVPVTRTLRPQLWSLLALALLLTALVGNRPRARRWLPLLFVVWANTHGGWIVGVGVLALWTFVEVCRDPRSWLEGCAIVAGCAAATLLTPYGWTLWEFLATTVRLSGRAIGEWQPLWNVRPLDGLPWIGAVGALIWSWFQRRPRRPETTSALALLAYASLHVWRIVPLYVLSTALLLGPVLRSRWPAERPRGATSPASEWPAAVVIVAVTLVLAAWVLSTSLTCIGGETVRGFDRAAIRRLQAAGSGKLVTFFDWGQYAIWHLAPTLRVSMDGRRETVYTEARLDEHGEILNGTPAGFAALRAWQAEYVWLPAGSVGTRKWLAENGYRLDHETGISYIASRSDLAPLPPAPTDAVPLACFPG